MTNPSKSSNQYLHFNGDLNCKWAISNQFNWIWFWKLNIIFYTMIDNYWSKVKPELELEFKFISIWFIFWCNNVCVCVCVLVARHISYDDMHCAMFNWLILSAYVFAFCILSVGEFECDWGWKFLTFPLILTTFQNFWWKDVM